MLLIFKLPFPNGSYCNGVWRALWALCNQFPKALIWSYGINNNMLLYTWWKIKDSYVLTQVGHFLYQYNGLLSGHIFCWSMILRTHKRFHLQLHYLDYSQEVPSMDIHQFLPYVHQQYLRLSNAFHIHQNQDWASKGQNFCLFKKFISDTEKNKNQDYRNF